MPRERLRHQFQRARQITVAGIDHADHIAGRPGDSLVHRVVQAPVRFADELRDPVPEGTDHVDGAVGGGAVDHDIFQLRVILVQHGADRFGYVLHIVADHGHY